MLISIFDERIRGSYSQGYAQFFKLTNFYKNSHEFYNEFSKKDSERKNAKSTFCSVPCFSEIVVGVKKKAEPVGDKQNYNQCSASFLYYDKCFDIEKKVSEEDKEILSKAAENIEKTEEKEEDKKIEPEVIEIIDLSVDENKENEKEAELKKLENEEKRWRYLDREWKKAATYVVELHERNIEEYTKIGNAPELVKEWKVGLEKALNELKEHEEEGKMLIKKREELEKK